MSWKQKQTSRTQNELHVYTTTHTTICMSKTCVTCAYFMWACCLAKYNYLLSIYLSISIISIEMCGFSRICCWLLDYYTMGEVCMLWINKKYAILNNLCILRYLFLFFAQYFGIWYQFIRKISQYNYEQTTNNRHWCLLQQKMSDSSRS